MMGYKISSIQERILEDFAAEYTYAADFVSTRLFKQCMGILGSVSDIKEIVKKNDEGIPPVETLLKLFEEHGYEIAKIDDNESRYMGALMAFVFKDIFRYKNQKDNVSIKNKFGIKTAALYYDGKEFELEE